MKKILIANGIPTKTNTQSLIQSPDGDTDSFDIKAGILQGATSFHNHP